MKKFYWIILFACFVSPVFAQSQQQTLVGPEKITVQGFGGPVLKFTSIREGYFGFLFGVNGGILLNNQFMLGVGAYGLVNDIRTSPTADVKIPHTSDMYLNMAYGGLMVGYTATPHRLIHVMANLLVGTGVVDYRYKFWIEGGMDWSVGSPKVDTDYFFVLEPSVNAELNLTRVVKVYVGGSYRFATGVGMITGLSNRDIAGPTINLGFKFGVF
jgi:hypothetical protein